MNGKLLTTFFVNNYFAQNDFNRPIRPFIDDQIKWYLEPNRTKTSNMYVMYSNAIL